jgi:uncharacterized protein (DUF1778 family)
MNAKRRSGDKAMDAMLAERPKASALPDDARQATSRRPRNDDAGAEVKINLRASTEDRDLIDRAAAARHTTRTEFMLASARRAAVEALLDQSFFVLDAARWDAFAAALDAPPKDNPRLKRLLARKAPWET